MKLKCPKCGNTETFYLHGFIERHEVVVDSDGDWQEDIECYDSFISDTASITCPKCSLLADKEKFEV